jgi:hypothetical protein
LFIKEAGVHRVKRYPKQIATKTLLLSGKFSANKLIVMKKAASRTFPAHSISELNFH